MYMISYKNRFRMHTSELAKACDKLNEKKQTKQAEAPSRPLSPPPTAATTTETQEEKSDRTFHEHYFRVYK